MKCLSIQQPWAHAILHLGKDVENRSWKTNFRGVVLVHAGKQVDVDGWQHLGSMDLYTPSDLPLGAILGCVEICGCTHSSQRTSDWVVSMDNWCFDLREPRPFKEPIPYKGSLGFFEVPNEVVLKAMEEVYPMITVKR